MNVSRKKTVRDSDPKIRQLGWDKLEPDALIDRTVQKIRKAADDAKRLADQPLHETERLPA
jgi:hypothetical protein